MALLYDAFISYSYAKDKRIASALQSAVQKLGKPWYRRRALRVFRDNTSLSATPELWPSIERALGRSRYFILLASPEAAQSKWVNKEVAYWLDHNSIDTLLLGVTDGELSWDETVGDFAARANTSLPPTLVGHFPVEPKWVDLRPYRDDADKTGAKLTEHAADFAAAVRGMPKEDLLSQEVRQQRRALGLAWSAAASLLLLVGLAGWQWRTALSAERAAIEQKRIAEQQYDRAEKALQAANGAASGLVSELASGTKDWVGIDQVFVTRILVRAQNVLLAAVAAGATQKEAEIRRSLAIVYSEMTVSKLRQGDPETAEKTIENAVGMFTKLHEQYPDNNSYTQDLLIVLRRQSDVFRAKGDPTKALQPLEESLAIARNLKQTNPADFGWLVEIEKSLTLSASVYANLDEDDKAARLTREANENLAEAAKHIQSEEIKKRLAASYLNLALFDKDEAPNGSKVQALLTARKTFEEIQSASRDGDLNSEIKFALVRVNKLLGQLFDKANLRERASEHARLAGQSAVELVRSDPQRNDWLDELAEIFDLVGGLCLQQGDLACATGNFRQMVQIRQTLLERAPRDERGQLALALAHYRLATAQHEAVPSFEKAAALLNPLARHPRYGQDASRLALDIDQRLAKLKDKRR